MLLMRTKRCRSCGEAVPKTEWNRHVCTGTTLPDQPALDLVAPGIAQAESGTLYYSGSLLLQTAQHTGLVPIDQLAALIGELVRGAEVQ